MLTHHITLIPNAHTFIAMVGPLGLPAQPNTFVSFAYCLSEAVALFPRVWDTEHGLSLLVVFQE
jgi:hypothetical protein